MNLPAAQRLHGLVAAVHTPFLADGALNLAVVEQQAAHFLEKGILTVFAGGTTGECSSLTVEERLMLAERWMAVVAGTPLRVVVHVGANCLADARRLASHAEKLKAAAIAALAPSYFKPRSLEALIACCAEIAAAAPETPFYYYDIPSMTGVSFSMPDFLSRAEEAIPTLAGMKFTNPDLMSYQFCLSVANGQWDLPFGVDEHLLGALAMGAKGAVGSGFNFAGPVYQRLFAAFKSGDMTAARLEQFHGVQLVKLFSEFGYMAAAKATMERIGVPAGPPRLPNNRLLPEQTTRLISELELMGFFDWIR